MYEFLVEWLLDTRHQVHCFGGRFSSFLANYLLNHLRLLRPGCFALEDNAQLPDRLFDVQRQDVVLVFDYRRYQSQALRVANAAKSRHARVVLFTDIYASPLREMADLIISAPVESASAFDSMVPALAQVEALVACLSLRSPDLADRLEGIDALRTDFDTHLLEEKNKDVHAPPHHSPRDLPFAADHTALLLVDMQRAWLEPQFDPHLNGPDAEYFLTRAHMQVVPNQRRLLSAFRNARQKRAAHAHRKPHRRWSRSFAGSQTLGHAPAQGQLASSNHR